MASATASVFDAVTAEITRSDPAARLGRPSQALTPACTAWARASPCRPGSTNFRSQAATWATLGLTAAAKMRPTSP